MSYGKDTYGQNAYGGRGYDGSGPSLKSSVPADGQTGVADDAIITIVLTSPSGIDVDTIDVSINGAQAVVGGGFQPTFTGIVGTDVEDCIIVISAHPEFLAGWNTIDIGVTDNAAAHADLSFTFQTWVIEETVPFSEASEAHANFRVPLTEAMLVWESATADAHHVAGIAENVALSESVSVHLETAVVVSETVPFTEDGAASLMFRVDVSDSVSIIEGFVPDTDNDAYVQENVPLLESFAIGSAVVSASGYTLIVSCATGLLLDGLCDPSNYEIIP